MSALRRLTSAVLLIAAAAATGCDLPAARPRAQVYTLFDLAPLAAGGTTTALLTDGPVPGGLPISHFLRPGGDELALGVTFTEGYRSAYATTELWSGFDEIWVQPAYVPVSGFDAAGKPLPLKDEQMRWRPIFSVGPRSAFYAPFWQLYYFVVGGDTPIDRYRSARDVLQSGLPLRPGEGRLMALSPGGIRGPQDPDLLAPGPLALPKDGQGWLDGALVSFLDFDAGSFRWDAQRNVEELPLFLFTVRDTSGVLRAPDIPTVGGNGPIGGGAMAPVDRAGQPFYGALWRVYTVEVPTTARIYAPAGSGYEATVADNHLPTAEYDPARDADAPRELRGRIALNPSCFTTGGALTSTLEGGPCNFLESQAKIESYIDPSRVRRTDILITCPFVSYHDQPVRR